MKRNEKIIKLPSPEKVWSFLKEYQKLCKKYDLQILAGPTGAVFVEKGCPIGKEMNRMFDNYVSRISLLY
jgi:hypothetical protein